MVTEIQENVQVVIDKIRKIAREEGADIPHFSLQEPFVVGSRKGITDASLEIVCDYSMISRVRDQNSYCSVYGSCTNVPHDKIWERVQEEFDLEEIIPFENNSWDPTGPIYRIIES